MIRLNQNIYEWKKRLTDQKRYIQNIFKGAVMAEKVRKERQSDYACRLIKGAIINGEFRPGDLLMEQDMVERFGIGRTPVREALQKLSVVGLVQCIPHKGVIVAVMSKNDVKNVLEIRCTLDSLAASLAAQRATEKDLSDIDAILNSPDYTESNKVYFDELLHKAIYKASHNDELLKILNGLYEKSVCMLSIGGLEREPIANMKKEISRIIDAIKNHDPEEASKAALDHVQSRNWF